jgi:hypothetical protein
LNGICVSKVAKLLFNVLKGFGRPPSRRNEENLEKIVKVIEEETRPTINDVCSILVLAYGKGLFDLSGDINVRRIATEFLTRLLNDDRNQNQIDVCKDLQFKDKNDIRFLYNFKADNNMENVFNPLNAELNPNCHLLSLLGAHPILYISRIRVKATKLRGYSRG